MRVVLDTNVILSGALSVYGVPTRLPLLKPGVEFFVPEFALKECHRMVDAKTLDENLRIGAKGLISAYLDALGTVNISNAPTADLKCRDPDDQQIFDAAVYAEADVICTYDVDDFPSSAIALRTPFALIKAFRGGDINCYIQPSELSDCGTVMFVGDVHHKASFGDIFQSDNGSRVYVNAAGYVDIDSEFVERKILRSTINDQGKFTLIIKYNKDVFEAFCIPEGESWSKSWLVTRAKCKFDANTISVFRASGRFFGHQDYYSAMPRMIKEKLIPRVLKNGSLDPVTGSLDLGEMISNVKAPI